MKSMALAATLMLGTAGLFVDIGATGTGTAAYAKNGGNGGGHGGGNGGNGGGNGGGHGRGNGGGNGQGHAVSGGPGTSYGGRAASASGRRGNLHNVNATTGLGAPTSPTVAGARRNRGHGSLASQLGAANAWMNASPERRAAASPNSRVGRIRDALMAVAASGATLTDLTAPAAEGVTGETPVAPSPEQLAALASIQRAFNKPLTPEVVAILEADVTAYADALQPPETTDPGADPATDPAVDPDPAPTPEPAPISDPSPVPDPTVLPEPTDTSDPAVADPTATADPIPPAEGSDTVGPT
jgi:hypothetical protein